MQIAKIVLYKDSQHVRVVPFNIGKVNIIVGDSKTGKSALIDIVDYCLASDECHVASGVIRDNVFWFAVVVDFGNDFYLFARQNPDTKQVFTISEMFMAKLNGEQVPDYDDIYPNTNIDSVKKFLASKIGLSENIQMVDDGGIREPIPVTFKHSRQFCFQPQSLIANKDLIFYNTTNTFALQALKDAIPYLYGAVRDDVLIIEQQIKSLKRELRQLKIAKNEQKEMADAQSTLAISLMEEAKAVGLTYFYSVESISNPIAVLQKVTQWEPSNETIQNPVNTDSEIQELVSQRLRRIEQLGDVQEKLSMAKRFSEEGVLYASELFSQHQRLKSIELIPQNDLSCCPLCRHKLETDVPQVREIYSTFEKISSALGNSQKQTQRNQKYLAELIEEESEIKLSIKQIEDSIHALYQREEDARKNRDLNVQRGKVIGRISLFLEKLQKEDNDNLDNRIEFLESEINKLKTQISKSTKEDLMMSKSAVINSYMNLDWKKSLDLEDEDAIVSFDPKRMQIYSISRDEKYVPLDQMGSGANWVGYHLLLHFALHKFFVKNSRPIPRFLFLDQPSQVYFPSDSSDLSKCKDIEAVKRMFKFIIERVGEMGGGFQVIMTEHANIQADFFKQNVVQEWYDGNKLIPEDWYSDELMGAND